MSQPDRSKLPIRKRPFGGCGEQDARRLSAGLGGARPRRASRRRAVTIGAYLGSGEALDRALADFAELHADQNELDYAALNAAVKTERVKAETVL